MYDLRTKKLFLVFLLLLLNKLFVTFIQIENLIINYVNKFKKYYYNQYSKEQLLLSITLISQYRYIVINKLTVVVTAVKIRGSQKQFTYRKFIVIFCISAEIIFNRILSQAIIFSDSLYVKNFNKINLFLKFKIDQ